MENLAIDSLQKAVYHAIALIKIGRLQNR